MIKIYGIKNCDTMKKALKYLDERGIAYDFVNYKKSGADERVLRATIDAHGWEAVINKRGTTWRDLPHDVKASMNSEAAVKIALELPSIIKRPLLVQGDVITLGFDKLTYNQII